METVRSRGGGVTGVAVYGEGEDVRGGKRGKLGLVGDDGAGGANDPVAGG